MPLTVPPIIAKAWGWGSAVTKGLFNTIPDGSASPIASFEDGFTLLNATTLAGGGVPPVEGDFNGLLRLLLAHSEFSNKGGLFPFQAGVSTAIGGYPSKTVLISNDGASCYVSLVDSNTHDFNSDPSSIGQFWAPWAGVAAGNGKYAIDSGAPVTATTFTGTINTATLTTPLVMTVSAVATGSLTVGQVISGAGIRTGTYIVNQLTGAAGGTGTYTVSLPHFGTVLTATAITGQTVNAPIVALNPPVTANAKGQVVTFKALTTNTGAITLNIGGGATAVKQSNGTALYAGMIQAGNLYTVVYDAITGFFWLVDSQESYQEGIWTPVVTGLVIDSGSADRLQTLGSYIKIGHLIFWTAFVGSADIGTPVAFHAVYPTVALSGIPTATGGAGVDAVIGFQWNTGLGGAEPQVKMITQWSNVGTLTLSAFPNNSPAGELRLFGVTINRLSMNG